MKKSIAFVLILTLIFCSFSFAFAESNEDAVLHVTEFNKGLPETTVLYEEESWQGIQIDDYDFIIIKQASDEIYVWTPNQISNKHQFWDRIIELSIDGNGDPSFLTKNGKGNGSEAEPKTLWTDVTFISDSDTIFDAKDNPIYHFNVMTTIEAEDENGEIIIENFGPAVIAKAGEVGHFDGGNYRLGEEVSIDLEKSVIATGTALKGAVDLLFKAEGLGDTVILENDTFSVNNFKFADEVTTKTFDDWQIRVNKLPCELKITEVQGGEDGTVGNSDYEWTNDSAAYYIAFDADGNVAYYIDEEMTIIVDEVAFANNVTTSRLYDIPYSIIKTVQLTENGSAKFDNNFEFSVVLKDKNNDEISSTIHSQNFKNASNKTISGAFDKIHESKFPCTVTIKETIGGGAAAGWTDDTNFYSMVYDIVGVNGESAERVGDVVVNDDMNTTAEAIEFINIYDNTSPKFDFKVDFTNTVKAVSEAAFTGDQNFEFSIVVKDTSGAVVDNITKSVEVAKPGTKTINYKSDKYLADAFPFTIEITETVGGSSTDGLQYWNNDLNRTITVVAALSGSSVEYSVANGDEIEFINTYGDNDLQPVDGDKDIENPIIGPTEPTDPTDPTEPVDTKDDNEKELNNTKTNNTEAFVKGSIIEAANINGSNIPLAEQSEITIPMAEMPQTGGFGIPLFYLLGGAITVLGVLGLIFFTLLGRDRDIAKISTGRREG